MTTLPSSPEDDLMVIMEREIPHWAFLVKRQYQFLPPRRWAFDFCWFYPAVAVEVEGGIWTGGRHTRGKGFEDDCVKYAEAAILGWRVIRVTPAMIADGRAIEIIRRALEV